MRLGICSGAAPDASLEDLVESAARRGLTALELREGDGHRIDVTNPLIAAAAVERAAARGVVITGYRAIRSSDPRALARLGELLEAPILIDGPADGSIRRSCALSIRDEGADAAVVIRGREAVSDAAEACDRGVDLAWDVEPGPVSLGRTVATLLDRAQSRLRHIRLHGGGPEADLNEGKGIGEMTGRLALAGYDGTVILTPTSPRYRIAWQAWLGRRGGWGCGSKSAEPDLVRLGDPIP